MVPGELAAGNLEEAVVSVKDGLNIERQKTVSMHQFETVIDEGDKIQVVASQDSGILANTESELELPIFENENQKLTENDAAVKIHPEEPKMLVASPEVKKVDKKDQIKMEDQK